MYNIKKIESLPALEKIMQHCVIYDYIFVGFLPHTPNSNPTTITNSDVLTCPHPKFMNSKDFEIVKKPIIADHALNPERTAYLNKAWNPSAKSASNLLKNNEYLS